MTKHGHGLPRKRPGRSAKDEIEAELPALEPLADELPELELIEELPTLEAIEDEPIEDAGPVAASCAASDEDGFDQVVTIHIEDMPKNEVPAALERPLARICAASASDLRHRRVLVHFTGATLIGSAVKDQVAKALAANKPLSVVVRRGFGDELVHEGSLPTVEVTTQAIDGVQQVEVATGDLEIEDLPVAMAPHMAELTEAAKGKRFVLQFRGAARPDATLRDAITMALREAGARSAAIGARVLFDRDLENRVQCSVSGNKATIAIALTDDDATTVDALSLVLPLHQPELDGKNVRFQFARESSAVQAFCVDFAKEAGARLIEVGGPDDTDIVWPPLVRVVSGSEVTLRLEPNGRSRAAVLAAFERECGEHHADTQGKQVIVDWPTDFVVDTEAEQCLQSVMGQLAPKRLCCTIGGEHREPFVPEPVQLLVVEDMRVVRIDSAAGKPRELQRAIDRRLPPKVAGLRGQAVRIDIVGGVALSRTLVSSLCSTIAEAGAMRLEIAEDGTVDVLLPPMLAITEGPQGFSIRALADGRDEPQQLRAIARELEGYELALQPVSVGGTTAVDTVVAAVLELGASPVVLDGPEPVRIHPPLIESVEKQGRDATFAFEPTGDAAMDARMLARELPARMSEVGMLAGTTITVAWPRAAATDPAPAQLFEALRMKQPAKILLDDGAGDAIQVYPEPKSEPVAPAATTPAESPAATATAAAAPSPAPTPVPVADGATGAADGAGLLTLLGRRDEAIPPLVLLGVAAGDDEVHLAAVEAELQAHLPRFRGRAVLLVPQQGGADAPVRRSTALVQMLARVVPIGAAATLVFRGPDAQGRPHFQVLHSTLRALPVGGVFGDPRAGAPSS